MSSRGAKEQADRERRKSQIPSEGKLGLIFSEPDRGMKQSHMATMTGLCGFSQIHSEFTSECRITVWLSQVSSSVARTARQPLTKLSPRRTNAVIVSLSLSLSLSLPLSLSFFINNVTLEISRNVYYL